MPTIEELEKQRLEQEAAAKKAAEEEAAKKAAEEERAKELASIPEALRGKSQKELSDMILQTNLELEKMKTELAQTTERLRPAEEPTEIEKRAVKERKFISDPTTYIDEVEKTLKEHVEARLRPLTEDYFSQQAESALAMARMDTKKYPDFPKYEKQVRELLDKMPINLRSNPQAIDLAVKLSRYPDLEKRYMEEVAREGLHSETGGTPPSSPSKKTELTDEQRTVAKRFGLTDEQYTEWAEKSGLE